LVDVKKSPKLYEKHDDCSEVWGWSHRAVAGFKIGDKVTLDTGGN